MSASASASFRTDSSSFLIGRFGKLFGANFAGLSLLTECISSRDRPQLFAPIVQFDQLLIVDLGGSQLD